MSTASKVKQDDLMALVSYVKVKKVINGGTNLDVVDVDTGLEYSVNGKPVVEKMESANQFDKTSKLTKTGLAELLPSLINRPFTVSFIKADGSTRVLRGRLVDSKERALGYAKVKDLEADKADKSGGLRQVDLRQIQYIISDGIKYELKK